jgi:uncharacterized membrane protein
MVTYTLMVTNTGNITDTFTIAVSGLYTASLSITNTGELGAGESASFYVMVEIPADAMAGDSDVTTVQVMSASDPEVTAEAALTTTVEGEEGPTEWMIFLPLVMKGYQQP